ncbi:MAG: FHA domain-containing protein [Actinomycetota bacterium]|nr:FHA domain-containing protein [Actinomycetota bacterium]
MAHLEVVGRGVAQLVPLESDRFTVGRADTNQLALTDDPSVSRLHAVLERYPGGWAIRDLGSRNGTSVQGQRLAGERPLHPGDEILVGSTRIVFHSGEPADPSPATETVEPLPRVTPREHDVLVALCRPVASRGPFLEPASTKEIADQLFVSEAAVKQHLLRLYEKFRIEEGDGRRVRLANEALRRGAVSLADVRPQPD